MSEPTIWPLHESQILSLQAVRQEITVLEQELRRRVGVALQEQAREHEVDPAGIEVNLELREGRWVLVVNPVLSRNGGVPSASSTAS